MNPNHYNPWSTPQELRTHLDTLFRKLQTPNEGRNYVLHTMAKGPARQVQARMGVRVCATSAERWAQR